MKSVLHKQLLPLAYALLAVLAFVFPTSIDGSIQRGILVILCAISLVVFASNVIASRILIRQLLLFLTVIASLMIATLISMGGADEISWGAIAPFMASTCLFLCDFSSIQLSKKHIYGTLLILNILVGCFGLGIVLHISLLIAFLENYYQAFYPHLLEHMISWDSKPVTFFGSHSVAAYFYFFLIMLNMMYHRTYKSRLLLALSILQMCLLALVKSTSALYLFPLMFIYAIWNLFHLSKFWRVYVEICGIGLFICCALYFGAMSLYKPVFNSSTNGFSSRYGLNTPVRKDIVYIADNPLEPVGFAHNKNLFYGDSGLVELWLRGSILLLFAYYGMAYSFFRRNLNFRYAIPLMSVLLLMELGFSFLLFPRFIAFLPFLVLTVKNCTLRDASSRVGQDTAAITLRPA